MSVYHWFLSAETMVKGAHVTRLSRFGSSLTDVVLGFP